MGKMERVGWFLAICSLWVVGVVCAAESQPLNPAGDVAVSPKKIALMHMVDDTWFFQEMAGVTLRNKRRYAKRHGYEMIVHNPTETAGLLVPTDCNRQEEDPWKTERSGKCYSKQDFALDKRAPTFGKIKLALQSCVGRSDYWLLWSDADALIVNQSIPLTSIVDDGYDMMVTEDWLMLNAGVMLLKCSKWMVTFLSTIHQDRSFDKALALDQSAIDHYMKRLGSNAGKHIKYLPKHVINVYTEEYRPGDFLLHMAGKLYEATVPGAVAITRQFDLLSMQEDPKSVKAFFDTRYLLNSYSGHCMLTEGQYKNGCGPNQEHSKRLDRPLGDISSPNRYYHARFRRADLITWKDRWDVPGWDKKIRPRA